MKSRIPLLIASIMALVTFAFFFSREPAKANKHSDPIGQKPPRTASIAKTVVKPEEVSNESALSSPTALEPDKQTPEAELPYTYPINLAPLDSAGILLTPDQRKELQAAYATVMDARLRQELSILTAKRISKREAEIEIPSYAAFGQQLKELTLSSFTDILGTELASKVVDQLDWEMNFRNRLWGKYPQWIHITYIPEAKEYYICHYINPEYVTTGEQKNFTIEMRVSQQNLAEYTKFAPLFPQSE